MIQRIQTLHLLAATLLAAVMLFVPLAWFGDYGRTVTMYAFDVRSELLTGAEGAGEPTAVSAALAAETAVAEAAVAFAVAEASAAESTPAEAETASTATAATTEGTAPVEGSVTAEGDVSVEGIAMAEGVASAEAAAPAESAAAAATAAGETLFSDPMPPYLGILLVLAAVLPLVTIFLFRRRLLQIRLCAVEMVLLIGALVMEAVYYFRLKALFADLATTTAHASLKLPMIFPLLALFFVFLASRAVFRDEMLVRAADRIR